MFLTCSFVGSEARKAAEAGKVNLEDISDDSEDSYDNSEEEDLESESDDNNEDNHDDEEEDFEMSSSAKKKRAPSRKTKTPTKNGDSVGVDGVDDVIQSINNMSVEEPVPKFSMDFSLPFIMKIFKEDDDEMVGIDVFVPTLPKDYFIPDIDAQGRVFVLGIRVPNFFKDENRVLAVNEGGQFNRNTYEAQAYKERCEEIEEHYGFASSIFGNAIRIKLPFQVEQRIVYWEIQGHENDLDNLTDDLGGQQYHFTLSAKLMKLKSKRRTHGGFRIIGGGANAMNDDL